MAGVGDDEDTAVSGESLCEYDSSAGDVMSCCDSVEWAESGPASGSVEVV